MNRKLLFLLILPLLAAGCGGHRHGGSSGGAKPAWVEGESPKWPRSRFVLGVASGDDEETAADRARGEVARVFSASVSVDTLADESETATGSGGGQSVSFSRTVAQTVRTATKRLLEGVEVVERWTDPSGRRYALAALEKGKALQALDEKLGGLDKEASAWKGRLDAAGDRFEKAKAAAKLSALLKARAGLEAERRVLAPGNPLQAAVDAGAARAAAAQALSALSVVVSAEGDGASALATGIVSGLGAAGLAAKTAAEGAAADLLAEASVSVEPQTGGDPRWKWARASATVTIKEGREGRSIARFDLSDRQAAADAGAARSRALSELAKKAASSVESSIRSYFEDQ